MDLFYINICRDTLYNPINVILYTILSKYQYNVYKVKCQSTDMQTVLQALTHYGDPALYSLGCSKSQDLVINDKSSQNNIIPERLVNL